jgi:hypothetical protein
VDFLERFFVDFLLIFCWKGNWVLEGFGWGFAGDFFGFLWGLGNGFMVRVRFSWC